jgi:hypothetical protein
MLPLATVDQFEQRYGSTIEDNQRLYAILEDASALVRSVTAKSFLDDDGVPAPPGAVVTVVCNVARRVYDNPTGVVHDTAGPFSTRYSEAAGQVLYLTPTDRAMLDRLRPTSGLWTMSTTRDEPLIGEPVFDRSFDSGVTYG